MKLKIIHLFYVLLMIINIISLYLIIDMSTYDEMVSYLSNGDEKFTNPKYSVMMFLITGVINLLFVSGNFMKALIFQKKVTFYNNRGATIQYKEAEKFS